MKKKIKKKIRSYMKKTELPSVIKNRSEEVLLHIGDIFEWDFPYIKKLIRQIRPDVLVHTGDLVDNLKVGRLPEHIPAYKKHAPHLIRIMERYAKKVYIVPGNNDLEDFIRENVTKAEIIAPNSCIEIGGIPFLLCHCVAAIDGEAKFYLYGHGPTGDTHSPEDNGKDGKYYFNAFFSPTAILLKSQSAIRLKSQK